MKELLISNQQQNLQLLVNIAKQYTEQLTSAKLAELLENQNCYHGLYFYLGGRIAFSQVSSQVSANGYYWQACPQPKFIQCKHAMFFP
jgi:hypothetical protein